MKEKCLHKWTWTEREVIEIGEAKVMVRPNFPYWKCRKCGAEIHELDSVYTSRTKK